MVCSLLRRNFFYHGNFSHEYFQPLTLTKLRYRLLMIDVGHGHQLPKKMYGFQAFCILPKDFIEIRISSKASLYIVICLCITCDNKQQHLKT